jgi:hypothetical protein
MRSSGVRESQYSRSALAGVLAQLKERMLTWYVETCDAVPHDADRRW